MNLAEQGQSCRDTVGHFFARMALKPKIGTMTENQCGADIMSQDEKLNLLSYALNSQTMATASNSEDDLDSFPEISPVEAAACPDTAQNDANSHRKKAR